MRAHADEYNVAPGRIGAYGWSAGGQLAALLGTRDTRDPTPILPSYPSRVACVVDLASVDPAANRFRVDVLAWRPTLWCDVALVQDWGHGDRPTHWRATRYARRADGERAAARLLLRRGYRITSWQ